MPFPGSGSEGVSVFHDPCKTCPVVPILKGNLVSEAADEERKSMTSAAKLKRTSFTAWVGVLLALTLTAVPCTAGRKKTAKEQRRPSKKAAATRVNRGKKPAKGVRQPRARWHSGVVLARSMMDKRDVKR